MSDGTTAAEEEDASYKKWWDEKEAYERQLVSLSRALQNKNDHLLALREDLQHTQQQRDDLERQLLRRPNSSEALELKHTVERLQAGLQRKDNDTGNTAVERFQLELSKAKTEHAATKQQLSRRMAQLTREQSALQLKLKTAEMNVLSAESKVSAMQAVHADETRELEERLRKVQRSGRQRETELTKQVIQHKYVAEECTEKHQTEHKKVDDELHIYEERARKADDINMSLREQLNDLTVKLTITEEQNRYLQKTKSALQETQDSGLLEKCDLEQSLTELQQQSHIERDVNGKLQTELSQVRQDLELAKLQASTRTDLSPTDETRHKEVVADLQVKIAALIEENNCLRDDVEKLHHMCQSYQTQNQNLQEKTSKYKERAKNLQTRIVDREREVEETRVSSSQAGADVLDLRMKLQMLEVKEFELESKLERSEAHTVELQEKIEDLHEKLQHRDMKITEMHLKADNNLLDVESKFKEQLATAKGIERDLNHQLSIANKKIKLQDEEITALQHTLINGFDADPYKDAVETEGEEVPNSEG